MNARRAEALVRGVRMAVAIAAGGFIAAAAISPLFGSVIDLGPTGRARASLLPLVLVVSDDAAVASILHSVTLAAIVAALAAIVGVTLGRVVAGKEFPGRDGFAALARAPAVYPPLFAALGVVGLARPLGLVPDGGWRWVALAWVELAWCVPRVMSAAAEAFARVHPSALDAARIAGAGRWRAWWSVAWPLTRGPVCLATAEVFALVLFEPGAPLALGLDRTLAAALVKAALTLDGAARGAALGVIGLGIALGGRAAILAWGGAIRPSPDRLANRRVSTGIGSMVGLVAWTGVALVPLAGLLALALKVDLSAHVSAAGLAGLARDSRALASLGHSLILGFWATLVAAVFAWGLGRIDGDRPSWRVPSTWPCVVPPLAIGLGVFVLPGWLDAMASVVPWRLGFVFRGVADLLDPFRHPWIPLIAAVATSRVPALRAAFAQAARHPEHDEEGVARTLGASRVVAWVTAATGRAAVLGAALAASIAASALDSGPALLLSPTLAARPMAPMILGEHGRSDAALAFVALALPIGAWIVGGARAGLKRDRPLRGLVPWRRV